MMMCVRTTTRRSHAFAARTTILACLGVLAIAPIVWSQSIETGAIVGSAVDEQGAVLPGTTVVLSSPTKGTSTTLIASHPLGECVPTWDLFPGNPVPASADIAEESPRPEVPGSEPFLWKVHGP